MRSTREGGGAAVVTDRARAERQAASELEAWRAQAVPDAAAPLAAEDVARLVRECFDALGVDPGAGAGFSVNTVHYYRRKDILDAPEGRTSSARYGLRHVWQAAGARLAGHLGLVTLAEARLVMRGAAEPALRAFVAARVADARARQAVRRAASSAAPVRARPLPGVAAAPSAPGAAPAVVIPLPGEAWCVLPAAHPARGSPAAARTLVRALAAALHLSEPE
jgi:hypothetical protein